MKKIFLFAVLLFLIKNSYSLQISSYSLKGLDKRRLENEDRYIISEKLKIKDQNISLFAVFDGHGGSLVSNFLQENFVNLLNEYLNSECCKILNFDYLLSDKCRNTFFGLLTLNINNNIKERNMDSIVQNVGSTGCIAFKKDKNIYFLNVGDSRAALFDKNGTLLLVTNDQKPSIKSKLTLNLLNAGAGLEQRLVYTNKTDKTDRKLFTRHITKYGNGLCFTEYVSSINKNQKGSKKGIEKTFLKDEYLVDKYTQLYFPKEGYLLGPESAFGDFLFEKYEFNAIANDYCLELTGNEKYLVLATDGFWDKIDNDACLYWINFILNCFDDNFNNLAEHLCKYARIKGSKDDITVIVVKF